MLVLLGTILDLFDVYQKLSSMKTKMTILIYSLFLTFGLNAQTTPPPPYNPPNNNALSNSNVNNNTGTPMVTNPVESNNPSVQAAIPINNQVSSLEAELPVKNEAFVYKTLRNDTAQKVAILNSNVDTARISTNIIPIINTDSAIVTTISTEIPKTIEIYNAAKGIDASTQPKYNPINLPNGNTVPITSTYVSQEVVSRFKNIYGESLYDIRLYRSAANKVIYIIRIHKNGIYSTLYLNENGEVETKLSDNK